MPMYSYSGPVMKFGKCIEFNWSSFTYAVSEKKAKSNLVYQCKKECNCSSNSKIELPGKVMLIDD